MTPPIVVILLTYARTEYAVRTVRAARKHLRYPDLRWYVADDGSPQEHVDAVVREMDGVNLIGWHTIPAGTYGANANKAWHVAHEHTDLTLWLEDDWEMQDDLDLEPYAQLLQSRSDIGVVRLGYLNLNMVGRVIGAEGRLYWLLDRNADPYVFTGHPSLRHRRFREAYGAYPEGLRPGETELAYAHQYRIGHGPEIVWPADYPTSGHFGHIGAMQSY